MDIESFQKSNAGRLVKVGSGMGAYWAFVPHPLPPALSVDMEVMHFLSEASRALGELAGLGRMMPNPQLFVRPFIRREAVLSSRIGLDPRAVLFPRQGLCRPLCPKCTKLLTPSRNISMKI